MSDRRHPRSGAVALLRRFAGDHRGVSAVEFALIAPFLILLYFGLAEFCQGYMAQRRMGHATSQVADIIARTDVVTRAEIDDVLAIGNLIIAPFPASALSLRVSSITRGTDGVARVVWSRGNGGLATARSGVVAVPAGLIANGENIIMSEATYRYTSPIGRFLPLPTNFSQTFYLRPRLVDRIGCSNC